MIEKAGIRVVTGIISFGVTVSVGAACSESVVWDIGEGGDVRQGKEL